MFLTRKSPTCSIFISSHHVRDKTVNLWLVIWSPHPPPGVSLIDFIFTIFPHFPMWSSGLPVAGSLTHQPRRGLWISNASTGSDQWLSTAADRIDDRSGTFILHPGSGLPPSVEAERKVWKPRQLALFAFVREVVRSFTSLLGYQFFLLSSFFFLSSSDTPPGWVSDIR